MKKLLLAITIGLLGQTTITNAATDWTAYLKPMLAGCDYDEFKSQLGFYNSSFINEDLPEYYKSSIISKNVEVDSSNDDNIITYNLKDAIAFEQPLLKIEYLQGFEWYHTKLYFKDNKFMALRPDFKLPKLDEYAQVTNNDANGYAIEMGGYLFLDFDEKEHSITCGNVGNSI